MRKWGDQGLFSRQQRDSAIPANLCENQESFSERETDRGAELLAAYRRVRLQTERLCEPLSPEDCAIQSMPDASPVRWHLAHTTWFFETFVLREATGRFTPYHPAYEVLFNSYYNQVGEQFPRAKRGLLSRPSLAEVKSYRRAIDQQMEALLTDLSPQLLKVVELGLHHEQQHQELIVTDVKHLLASNPLFPIYREWDEQSPQVTPPLKWHNGTEGIVAIGHAGEAFAYDNEGPCHKVLLAPHKLASRPVTCGEYREFIADGGYRRPELWLSLGWQAVQDEAWHAPLYWHQVEDQWYEFTLGGLRPLDQSTPVCHVSYFEADAFARWAGTRLPTEAEWETAAVQLVASDPDQPNGHFAESGRLHPACTPAAAANGWQQLFGDVWEWTASPYTPYPGYAPPPGAIGEYNGKFMCNQYVLRGGSCATPRSHIRATYRNFFSPWARWQFSGIRLAK